MPAAFIAVAHDCDFATGATPMEAFEELAFRTDSGFKSLWRVPAGVDFVVHVDGTVTVGAEPATKVEWNPGINDGLNPNDELYSAIGINSLFAETSPRAVPTDEARELIEEAQLILGVDVMSRHEFVVFGRALLQRVADENATEEFSLVRIEIDQETEELELLTALVEVVKGFHEYQ